MTIFRATLLGTSSAQPTIARGLSSTALSVFSDRFLVDCGEGTQRQLLRFGLGLRVDMVFFTHFHADHYLGIIGLLRTLAMNATLGDTKLQLYGPGPFITEDLPRMVLTGVDKVGVVPEFRALRDGDVVTRRGYSVRAVSVEHRVPTLGYVVEEPTRPGRFDLARARSLGLQPGPLYSQLQAGKSVVTPEGRVVLPEEVVGPSRRGRKLCISGDTRPCRNFVNAVRSADVLIHESTFSDEEQERAEFTQHSTAAEAGWVAREAGVKQLVLSHFSSRHDTHPELLVREAQKTFPGRIVAAYDGMSVDLPPNEADASSP